MSLSRSAVLFLDADPDESNKKEDDRTTFQQDNVVVQNSLKNKTSNTTNIRLLLHAVNGVVPYLTPKLLRDCFPAHIYADILWMGMAVRDTCVGPVFDDDDNDTQQQQQQQQQQQDDNGGCDNAKKRKQPQQQKKKKKARGYIFSRKQHAAVDAWMQPYTRVAVPTFDMVDDHHHHHHHHHHVSSQSSSQSEMIAVTDQHVLLWTPHGRQALTPTMYMECCAAAAAASSQGAGQQSSHVVVSLFDTIPPTSSSTKINTAANGKTNINNLQKREDTAIRRTQLWNQQHRQQSMIMAAAAAAADAADATATATQEQIPRLPRLWSPSILDDNLPMEKLDAQIQRVFILQHESTHPGTDNGNDKEKEEDDESKNSTTSAAKTIAAAPSKAGGVALIGWSHLNSQNQAAVMERLLLLLPYPRPLHKIDDVAVLSTNSLHQILQAIRLGINVLGCNLPTKWALHKMAFIVDIASWRQRQQQQQLDSSPSATTTTTTTAAAANTTGEPVPKQPRLENPDNNSNRPDEHEQQQLPAQLNQDGCVELVAPMHPNENDDNINNNNNSDSGINNNNKHDDITQRHAWFRDDRPMLPGCTCHACQTHSRAYIYHLVCAKELLAEVLLFIHNLHHLLVLIRECNHAIALVEDDTAAAAAAAAVDICNSIYDTAGDHEQQQQQEQQQSHSQNSLLEDLIQHVKSQTSGRQ
jgi:Queuine tRNA-ribosyltransferase